MLRRLFTFASALSLVLCVATAALWTSGLHYQDKTESPVCPLPGQDHGMLLVWIGDEARLYLIWGKLGFQNPGDIQREVSVPGWLLLPATAVLPAVWLWRAVRQRGRRTEGYCLSCGYDLRATPDRCPECGTAVEQARRPA